MKILTMYSCQQANQLKSVIWDESAAATSETYS